MPIVGTRSGTGTVFKPALAGAHYATMSEMVSTWARATATGDISYERAARRGGLTLILQRCWCLATPCS